MLRYPQALVLAAVGLVACGTKDTSQSCAADYDCAVGQVCTGATSGASDGTCSIAAAGASRTFGQLSLDFTDPSATYLVSVVHVPAGAEAISNSFVPFSLAGAGAGAAALRLAPMHVRAALSSTATAAMQARWAFDVSRHARVAQIVRNYVNGVYPEPSAAATAATCDSDCGDTEMCWQGTCTTSPVLHFLSASTEVTGDLLAVVPVAASTSKINVVVEHGTNTSIGDQAVSVVEDFAKTFGSELLLLGRTGGHVAPMDVDGDGRLTVMFTNQVAGAATLEAVGFFEPFDFLPAGTPDATGNASDILWARLPGSIITAGEITPPLLTGTLAHEYQHLVNYAVRVQARGSQAKQEVIWLDEGLAHLMEDLTGWGASNIGTVSKALSGWNEGTLALSKGIVASLSADADQRQRGKAFLLLRHLVDTRGSSSFLADLLNENSTGLEHTIFANGAIADLLGQLQLAVYATGNQDITLPPAHASDFSPVTTSSVTTQKVGIDTHGSYTDARGNTVELSGPEDAAEVDLSRSASDLADGSITPSGTLLYVVTGGSGTVHLRGTASADADLHVTATRVK